MQVTADVDTVQQIGLRLPDGTEIFSPNTFHDRRVDTPEDRRQIVEALTVSAHNLGIDPAALLANYRWIVRDFRTITVPLDSALHDIDDPNLVAELPAVDDENTPPN